MIYIYRREPSISARALADVVGRRLQQNWRRVRPTDHVVCWGDHIELANQPANVTFLNNTPIRSKFVDAETLKAAGVATISVSRTQPQLVGSTSPAPPDAAFDLYNRARDWAEDFASLGDVSNPVNRTLPLQRGVVEGQELFAELARLLQAPAPLGTIIPGGPDPEWIGRANSHVGGTDLLAGTGQDYFTKKEDFISEYRVHSFGGVSIRAGKKIHREGVETPHPWIRSWEGGWKISYDGDSIRQRHRDIAHAAISALGLHFGAVDIGERQDKSVVVLEVNRAPGLEGGTIDAYAKHLREWAGVSA